MTSIDLKTIVLVGDASVGKASLFGRKVYGEFPTPADKLIDKTIYKMKSDSLVDIELTHSSAQELSVLKSAVTVICFAIDSPGSLESVTERLYPEVMTYQPDLAIYLVGLKSDLRDVPDDVKSLITVSEAQKVAGKISAVKYLECSAKLNVNVTELFDELENTAKNSDIKSLKERKGPTHQVFFCSCSIV